MPITLFVVLHYLTALVTFLWLLIIIINNNLDILNRFWKIDYISGAKLALPLTSFSYVENRTKKTSGTNTWNVFLAGHQKLIFSIEKSETNDSQKKNYMLCCRLMPQKPRMLEALLLFKSVMSTRCQQGEVFACIFLLYSHLILLLWGCMKACSFSVGGLILHDYIFNLKFAVISVWNIQRVFRMIVLVYENLFRCRVL